MTGLFKVSEIDLQKMLPFLKNRVSRYYQTFTLNFLLFEPTFFIINQMFMVPKQNQDSLVKSLAIIFYDRIADFRVYFA